MMVMETINRLMSGRLEEEQQEAEEQQKEKAGSCEREEKRGTRLKSDEWRKEQEVE